MRTFLASLLVLLCACGGTIQPSLTEPGTGVVFYACNWYPNEPSAKRLVVDLVLFTPSDANVSEDEAVSIVQQAGGLVTHRFNTNLLRAEIEKIKIPGLITDGVVETAFVVNDPDALNARLDVLYDRLVNASDVAAITNLGASVDGEPVNIRISVIAPDEIIFQIKSLPGVSVVRAKSIGCAIPM